MSTRIQVSVLAASFVVLAAGAARADETGSPETPAKAHNGGYGAPELRVTSLAGTAGILFGSQGGWIHDHVFVLGGAGYGLVNDVTPSLGGTKSAALSLGYGGVRPGVVIGSSHTLHFTGGVLLGGGGLESGADDARRSDMFFVVEPDAAAEINVLRWMRVAIGASYRFPIGDTALRFAQLSGPSGTLAVKLGSF